MQIVLFGDHFRRCQSLFSGKNKINICYLPSAEFAERVVKVDLLVVFSALVL